MSKCGNIVRHVTTYLSVRSATVAKGLKHFLMRKKRKLKQTELTLKTQVGVQWLQMQAV